MQTSGAAILFAFHIFADMSCITWCRWLQEPTTSCCSISPILRTRRSALRLMCMVRFCAGLLGSLTDQEQALDFLVSVDQCIF